MPLIKNAYQQKVQKAKQDIGLADITYLAGLAIVLQFFMYLMPLGGIYSLAFPALLELGRAGTYWARSSDNDLKDSSSKKWLNRFFYTARAIIVNVGLGLAMGGVFKLGFTLLNSMGYATLFRSLGKTFAAARSDELTHDDKVKKVGKHLGNVIVGGMITVAFSLMTFFPHVNPVISFALLISSTGFVLISTLLAKVPPLIVEGIEPPALRLMKEEGDVKEPLLGDSLKNNSIQNQDDNNNLNLNDDHKNTSSYRSPPSSPHI